jgi:hypothetical protein
MYYTVFDTIVISYTLVQVHQVFFSVLLVWLAAAVAVALALSTWSCSGILAWVGRALFRQRGWPASPSFALTLPVPETFWRFSALRTRARAPSTRDLRWRTRRTPRPKGKLSREG